MPNNLKVMVFLSVAVFMTVGMVRSIGLYGLLSMELSILMLTSSALCCFLFLNRATLTTTQWLIPSIFFLLFVYTGFTSRNPSLSLILCFFMVASSILFTSLLHADRKFLSNINSTDKTHPISNSAKLAFVICSTIHALTMVSFYIFAPERTTGLMDDFSQASMLLLLAYGIAYPLLKEKIYFSAFSLLYFTAFFTTFSRTANFLLIVLFAALFILEYKNTNTKRVMKLAFLALLALGFVYLYPEVVGQQTVDRGGLSHFSSLNSRTIYWQTAWEAIKQEPLMGYGLGLYGFTGINEAQPFNIIHYVHNDYLQIWHDLGLFWFTGFISTLSFLLIKHIPARISWRQGPIILIDTSNQKKFLAWSLLATIAMYMGINFLILNIEFQVAISIILVDLLRK